MKLGETGLKVDYIIQKLRDYDSTMDNGNDITWSSVNTEYLVKYLKENMPDMLPFVNIISTSQEINNLYYEIKSDGETPNLGSSSMNSIEASNLTQVAYIGSEVGDSVDSHRGSPYSTWPLRTLAVPVDFNKRYRLVINYNNADSVSYNFLDPSKNWSLVPYSVVGLYRGAFIYEGTRLVDPQYIVSNPPRTTRNYLSLDLNAHTSTGSTEKARLGLRYYQSIQILSTDTLVIKGNFYINNEGVTAVSTAVVYDNINEALDLDITTSSGVVERTLHIGDIITLVNSSGDYYGDGTPSVELTRGGETYNLVDELNKNLTISIVSQTANGINISVTLRVEGYTEAPLLDSDNNELTVVTGERFSYTNENGVTISFSVDSSGNILASTSTGDPVGSELTINAESQITIDGTTYSLLYSGLTLISNNVTSFDVASVDDYEDSSYTNQFTTFITVPSESELVANTNPSGTSYRVTDTNDEPVLIIQIPRSTTEYSLVEIGNNEYSEVTQQDDGSYSLVQGQDNMTINTENKEITYHYGYYAILTSNNNLGYLMTETDTSGVYTIDLGDNIILTINMNTSQVTGDGIEAPIVDNQFVINNINQFLISYALFDGTTAYPVEYGVAITPNVEYELTIDGGDIYITGSDGYSGKLDSNNDFTTTETSYNNVTRTIIYTMTGSQVVIDGEIYLINGDQVILSSSGKIVASIVDNKFYLPENYYIYEYDSVNGIITRTSDVRVVDSRFIIDSTSYQINQDTVRSVYDIISTTQNEVTTYTVVIGDSTYKFEYDDQNYLADLVNTSTNVSYSILSDGADLYFILNGDTYYIQYTGSAANNSLVPISIYIDYSISNNQFSIDETTYTIVDGDTLSTYYLVNDNKYIVDGVTYELNFASQSIVVGSDDSVNVIDEDNRVVINNVSYTIGSSVVYETDNGSVTYPIDNNRFTINNIEYTIMSRQILENVTNSQYSDAAALSIDNTVTDDYLDIILLDRTITPYSPPDDIDWLQDLCEGHYQTWHRGVYDSALSDYVKYIQKFRLNRSSYITGFCDPETELYLEILYGY